MAKSRLSFSMPPELLRRYKEAFALSTNYAVAKRLGVTPQAVALWERGHGMDDTSALQMAQELGIPPLETIAEIRVEQAKTDRERSVWEKYCARVFVATMVTATLAATLQNHEIIASVFDNNPHSTTYTLCALTIMAMMWLRRRTHVLAARLRVPHGPSASLGVTQIDPRGPEAAHRSNETAFRVAGHQRLRPHARDSRTRPTRQPRGALRDSLRSPLTCHDNARRGLAAAPRFAPLTTGNAPSSAF